MKTSENPYGVAPNTSNTPPANYTPIKNNGLAIASLILGILSLVFLYLLCNPWSHNRPHGTLTSKTFHEGKGLALAGLILSYVMLVLSIIFIVWMIYMFTSVPGFSDAFKGSFMDGLNHRR